MNPRTRKDLGSHLGPLLPVLAITIVVHQAALGTFFAQDDVTFLSRAAGIQPSDSFRVLSEGLAFRVLHGWFGLDPFGYHAVNLALHLLNVIGVHLLAAKLTGRPGIAAAAAMLFGASGIAFTPIHWASGIVNLLACTFTIAATLLHLESWSRGVAWRWAAALCALLGMLSKESSAAWILIIALFETRITRSSDWLRRLLPATTVTAGFVVSYFVTGQSARFADSSAYSISLAPGFLIHNLSTYLLWSVAIWEPIRDVLAHADVGAWRMAIPVTLALALAARRSRQPAVLLGVAWWLAFLLPVLPLPHHAYLYYLYVPWVGGAIAVATIAARLAARAPAWIPIAALVTFALVEWRNAGVRESITRDHLPVDRTMRDALLLRHSLTALRAMALPPGTAVMFVSPLSRERFDLVTSAPTRSEDLPHRRSYRPLESAMRGGETLRLFFPGYHYLGFADTIPPHAAGATFLHFDQLGRLENWGKGREALLRQAAVQQRAGLDAAAERTRLRARAAGEAPSPDRAQLFRKH